MSNGGVVGAKLTFWIKIRNLGALTDSFKVRRSAGYNNGYRVRYYDAANNDITGQVTKGTFTTPTVANFGEYVMRATVKVRSLATLCSFTSRLITVSSVGNPNDRDAVRFTARRATDLNCPPVAVNDKASVTENTPGVFGNLFANDIDPDGDPIDLSSLSAVGPLYGFISVNPVTGSYGWSLDDTNSAVIALDDGETLTQVIQYSVEDGFGAVSNTATLTITIRGVTNNPCVRHAGVC